MAKKKELSPEERLEAALLPEEEWPYEVPANWCWTKIGVLSSLHRGVSYKKDDAYTDRRINDCLVLRGGNIGEGYIDVDADNVYVDSKMVTPDQLVKKNDIIIVASTGSTKVIGRAGVSLVDYSNVAFGAFLMVVRPSKNAVPRYMDFYFQSDMYRNRIRDLASGVNINNIRSDYITESPYPLPPLPEQHRIVSRIESLFSKLDEAKEAAQAVVDGFEDRKAAILHKAFTGELTREWRISNNISSSWEIISFGSIIVEGPQNGLYKPRTAYGQGTKILRIDGFYDGYLKPWDTLKRLSLEKDEKDTYLLHINDIVVNRVNSMPFLGKSALIRELPEDCVFESNMMRIAIDLERAYPEYIISYLNSSAGLIELRKNAKQAVNQASINQQDVKAVSVPLPHLTEQMAIVDIVEGLIMKELKAKDSAESVLDQIDTMKKAILARAFRGELGTNDIQDESAVELLKRVMAVKE